MKTRSFFDIETGPLPTADIAHLMPEFAAPANYKDPAKIADYIANAQARWLEQAALSPITGRVLCIGVLNADGVHFMQDPQEAALLKAFWEWARTELYAGNELVGWCIHHFDLPFVVKRSWALRVPVPSGLRGGDAQQYWHPLLVDLQRRWQMGDNQCESSLDICSKFVGLPGKNGDGKDFAKLWATDKKAALAYLERDLELTRDLHDRMTASE